MTERKWSILLVSPDGVAQALAYATGLDASRTDLVHGEEYVSWEEVQKDAARIMAEEDTAILRRFVRGTTTPHTKCSIVARNAKRMLVRIAGGSGWEARGRSKYYPTEYLVVDVDGQLAGGTGPYVRHVGRLKPADRERLLKVMQGAV